MANKEHLKILSQGVEVWNEWRKSKRGIRPDLLNANLSGKILSNVYFYDTNLGGANLSYANLTNAEFTNAWLNQADLHGATLSRADFRGAYLAKVNMEDAKLYRIRCGDTDLNRASLRNADLSGADLMRTNLERAELSGANFSYAYFQYTILADVDLSQVDGLTEVYHQGPSSIGIDTIYRSKGNIPEVFLRGVGVPDDFITYMKSLVGKAIEFYSCFISYSHKDEEFTQRLYSRMRDEGLRTWYAPEDIKGGRKLHEQIDEAIRLHDKLLIILSENSMESEWVITEIRKARKREIEAGYRILFPIRLVDFETIKAWKSFDADSGKDLAVELREYFIPDFQNWKNHDSFEKAFSRLLQDLRAESLQ